MDWNAYHFVSGTLRDGTPVPADGVALKFDGKIELCASGYHASRKAWQALKYAPGHTLCRVHCSGKLIESDDKLVCTERTIISRIDASDLLWSFARQCALDVIDLWDAPRVVREYLETGDDGRRDAAMDAAMAAARAAARDAAMDAAMAAARDAAMAVAWAAARAAARDAAMDAARYAAMAADWDADWAAALKKQRARFTRLVNQAFSEVA